VDAGSPGRLPRCANFTRVFRPRLLGVATALAFVSLPASMAQANIYTQVLQVYETNATVPPCQFSSKQLESALKGVNTYGQQYFADFTAAVQTALDQRASGACAPEAGPGHGRDRRLAARADGADGRVCRRARAPRCVRRGLVVARLGSALGGQVAPCLGRGRPSVAQCSDGLRRLAALGLARRDAYPLWRTAEERLSSVVPAGETHWILRAPVPGGATSVVRNPLGSFVLTEAIVR
jgi:hypothetical protein